MKTNSQLWIRRVRYWCLRNIPYARVLSREDISIDLLMGGTRETRAPRVEVSPGCRSDLRVGTGRRDRRSKYWDIGTLSPRSSFRCLQRRRRRRWWRRRRKKKSESRWRKENSSLPRGTHTNNSSFPIFLWSAKQCPLDYVNSPSLLRMLVARTNANNTIEQFHFIGTRLARS